MGYAGTWVDTIGTTYVSADITARPPALAGLHDADRSLEAYGAKIAYIYVSHGG